VQIGRVPLAAERRYWLENAWRYDGRNERMIRRECRSYEKAACKSKGGID
jgi:hypothetical protein